MPYRQVLPPLTIKGKHIPVPIVQGGMGIGVSLSPLASAVAVEGGLGIVSSACLDLLTSRRLQKELTTYQAVREEMSIAKDRGGVVDINIMVAIAKHYEDSVRAAIDAGVDVIISGGGLPLSLPAIKDPGGTALVPIVSSARALELICRKWERHGYRPDAVILEGPLAGGHLGFKFEEISLEENKLENLLPPVKETAQKYGNFPVIVACGIFTHEDILSFLHLRADGVQMGTRFLVTEESSASMRYKTGCCGCERERHNRFPETRLALRAAFPDRRKAPMFISAQQGRRKPRCDKGYVQFKDKNGSYLCRAKSSSRDYFCICNGLLSSAGYNMESEEPLYTVGTNGYRVDKTLTVKDLMNELTGSMASA